MNNPFYFPILIGFLFLPIISLFSQDNTTGCDTFLEKEGILIMEAEDTQSPLGLWVLKQDVENYLGKGHIEFTGNGPNGGDPSSPLTYSFKIQKEGYYRMIIRARKRLEGHPPDKNNDGYVRISGNFEEGPQAGDNHQDDAPLSALKKDTKLYGGEADQWGYALELDLGGHDNKRNPIYKFKAGETYILTLSGRSINWNVDRIIFFHQNKDITEIQNMEIAASECL